MGFRGSGYVWDTYGCTGEFGCPRGGPTRKLIAECNKLANGAVMSADGCYKFWQCRLGHEPFNAWHPGSSGKPFWIEWGLPQGGFSMERAQQYGAVVCSAGYSAPNGYVGPVQSWECVKK